MARFMWFLLLLLITQAIPVMGAVGEPDSLASHSAILMEARTGEILFAKNEHEPLHPASITKIMTLLLIMETLAHGEVSLENTVIISSWAAAMGGSQIWLETGEEMLFRDLLKAVAIASANDASVALAEHIYGSEASFVAAMNRKAKELGMENTVFYNCTGLPGSNEAKHNLTSAYDVALMSKALLEYPDILNYTSIWIDYVRDGASVLNNTNRLVRHFPGVDGLKTGYTSDALFCLAATGTRDNVRVIAVVMKAPSSTTRFDETAKLLTYGFGHYKGVVVARAGDIMAQVPVAKGMEEVVAATITEDLIVPVRRGTKEDFQRIIKWRKDLQAPVNKGESVGYLEVIREGKIMLTVPLVASDTVARGKIGVLANRLAKKFFQRMYRIKGFSSIVSE